MKDKVNAAVGDVLAVFIAGHTQSDPQNAAVPREDVGVMVLMQRFRDELKIKKTAAFSEDPGNHLGINGALCGTSKDDIVAHITVRAQFKRSGMHIRSRCGSR